MENELQEKIIAQAKYVGAQDLALKLLRRIDPSTNTKASHKDVAAFLKVYKAELGISD